MDKNYWNNYYKIFGKDGSIMGESSFANFCFHKFLNTKSHNILELGSGNGRDARFFAKQNHKVFAIDQSHAGISIEADKFQNNVQYIEDDFVNLDYTKYQMVDVIYSRFTLHAITSKDEELLIEKLSNFINNKLLMIEARTTKDPLCGIGTEIEKNTYMTDHRRRFIDTDAFIKKMLEKGFKLLYFTEENNLSIYKEDNPYLMRIVLTK